MSKSSTTTDGVATPGRVITHPGEVLAEEFLKPLGLSGNALAIALRVPATRIGAIVAARWRTGIDAAGRFRGRGRGRRDGSDADCPFPVVPAKAGTHCAAHGDRLMLADRADREMGPGFRRGDGIMEPAEDSTSL